jgi:hypothetical protein
MPAALAEQKRAWRRIAVALVVPRYDWRSDAPDTLATDGALVKAARRVPRRLEHQREIGLRVSHSQQHGFQHAETM